MGSRFSPHTGIIRQMQTYSENAYLQLQLLEPLELECKVPDSVENVLSRNQDSLTTDTGAAVQILYQSPVRNSDGTTTLRLTISGMEGVFGESLKDEKIYTGRVYQNALVLDLDCGSKGGRRRRALVRPGGGRQR